MRPNHCDKVLCPGVTTQPPRQVVIGGKSKYLINGHTAQNEKVYNLFRTVQLNVKNPHFLIMQGRISKVLNMKPLEILGMIEESAGTKMYEDKRTQAQKTLEKKDKKCEEITQVCTLLGSFNCSAPDWEDSTYSR